MTLITDLVVLLLPLFATLLAVAFALAALAHLVHTDNPGRPPARIDGWSAGSLPSQPYGVMRR